MALVEQYPNQDYQLPAKTQAMIDASNAARAAGGNLETIAAEIADDKSYANPSLPMPQLEKDALAKSRALLDAAVMRSRHPVRPPTIEDGLIDLQQKRYGDK